ncbi:MAG TPA: sugar ABC transporter permease [Candidatus Limnocylindria bacterium]|jgi:D-xylose transport system permease protein|nr:sugar ABC transporter permease [Candidatus Limnocylindria bacterium]
MADALTGAPAPARAERRSFGAAVAATEVDLRLFGMLIALVGILVGFHIMSGGKLIQPANMITLAVQASGVAIMATGMVLIIVSRGIDLSVGSLVGVVAMCYALLMTDWLPALGLGIDHPIQWIVALAIGLGIGASIGAVQGFIIAYVGVPSFIVTLGGLLSLRGSVWLLSSGAAVSGLQTDFRRIGGGVLGSVGELATWAIGVGACIAIVGLIVYNRRQRQRFGFAMRPIWAEVLLAALGCAAAIGLSAFANASYLPAGLATQYAVEHGITEPAGGLKVPMGYPWPVLLVIGVTIVMTFIATRRRFGRYVYAYGGNPDAAELAGINTRWTIMKTFILMGLLCAVAAAIGSARLNGATLDVGQSDELYVIAAAVVGGTSFAGGIGTIPGAVLGAFVMQSLAYGLSFNGVNSPTQNVVAGIVLIVAVAFDTFNRRRGGGR